MVRNVFLVIAFLLFATVDSSFAQCTANNSHTEFGAYSSLGKNKIPDAWLDSVYSEVLTLVVPATFQGFTINQITLKDVPNLYTGLEYKCNPPSCVYPGGANGCILIEKTPTEEKEVNRAEVTLELYVESSLANFDTVINIDFRLLDSATLSTPLVPDHSEFSFFPNPANDKIAINLPEGAFHNVSIELMEMNGRLVKEIELNDSGSNIELPIDDVDNGIYFLKCTIDNTVLKEKLIIQH